MTAKDLLHKVLEYRHSWAARDVVHEKPAAIRLAQIEALLAAFGLTKQYVNTLVRVKYSLLGNEAELDRSRYLNGLTNLEYVLGGEFLRDRPYERYLDLAETARAKMREVYGHVPEDWMARPVHITWLFNYLLNYRQELYAVSIPERGMLEGFAVGLLYAQELANKVKQVLRDNTTEIDDTLWLLLDPDKRDITKERLMREYGYPDPDLNSIDLDWRMENY